MFNELETISYKIELRLATIGCLKQVSLSKDVAQLNNLVSNYVTDNDIKELAKERYTFIKEHKLLVIYLKTMLYGLNLQDKEVVAKSILCYIGSVYALFFLKYIPYCNEQKLLYTWSQLPKRSLFYNKSSHLEVVTTIITSYLTKYELTKDNLLRVLTLIVNSVRDSLRVFANTYYR